jgi:hypothetical protein
VRRYAHLSVSHLRDHAERIASNVPTGHKPGTKMTQSHLRLVK